MKFTVEREPFLKALNHGQSVVEKRTTVPILSHVLLKADSGKLVLTTTDMEISIIESIGAEVHRDGAAAVPARMIHDVVRRLKEGAQVELDFDSVKGVMTLTSGRSNFTFSCQPAEDFPAINVENLPNWFSLPAKDLYSLFERTRFAMSTMVW